MAIPVLPESAPFTPAQRAWLNGFFAGVLSFEATAADATRPQPALAPVPAPAAQTGAEEAFPWHDATLPLAQRLELAAGRSLPDRLMAAMAQLDCGSCGYMCKTYAHAIAGGDERDLARCTPGGRETSRALKLIMAEANA